MSLSLLTAMIVEGQSALRSFHASDLLVANLTQSIEQQDVLLDCRQMRSMEIRESGTERSAGSGEKLAALGVVAGLGAGQIEKLLHALNDTASSSLAALCVNLERSIGVLHRDYGALMAARVTRQSHAYQMVFITANLVALMLVLVIILAILYANSEAATMRRIDRARRAVLQIERRQAGFLAAAGHDLRQPLQALRLFLSLLLRRQLDPETRAIGGKMDVAAASMQRMIGSLVDVAKLDAGLVAADRRDVRLTDFLGSFMVEFQQAARDAGLAFSVEQTDAVIHSDPDLLERILRNLIGNAIRYTKKGGVSITIHRMQRYVTVAVRDTGSGIQSERLQAVFEDFFRVEQADSDGLGLGLGIVRRLSDLLEAPVRVESTFGFGSVFSIDVPLGAQQPLQESKPVPPGNALTKFRLSALVVDDNELVRDALASQLEQWNLNVFRASSYHEAWILAAGPKSEPIDIVITDYDLGDRTGLELLQGLEQAAGHKPCALIVTATTSDRARAQIRNCDYVCLQKPIDSRRLEEAVERLQTCARSKKQPALVTRDL